MEAWIPKLFILTAEASIVLFLILVTVFIFSSKAKRKDIKAANQLIKDYLKNKENRISSLKKQLTKIGFSGDADAQAEKLYDQEKSLIKEFVTLYLKRDTYRLLDYSEAVEELDDSFLKISGTASSSSQEPEAEISATEENANATIMAREQAELNEAHLKELSELRLKNTELNEHLFEALETVTSLMTEHGKKTGQEVETNAQRILEAIIYLRDNRLGNETDPSSKAPSADDGHDQVDDPWSIDLADNDATLDDSPNVDLGINNELNTDLDSLDTEASTPPESAADTPEPETVTTETNENEATDSEDDPWAAALSEQAEAETSDSVPDEAIPTVSEEADPWAEALAEQENAQATTEPDTETETAPEPDTQDDADPWAEALAEQAEADAQSESPGESPQEEDDPWAAALAEQAATDATTESPEPEDDPWAAALAEQEQAEKK